MEGEPLDEVQWRAPELIQAFGGLRTDNVLEYFSQSPFYDRSSNNQVLKMQSQFSGNLYARQDLYRELRNMKGVEFVVVLARDPDMWIIRKQNRLGPGPQEVRPISTYFVVGENVYMAPQIYSVVASRLLSTTLALNNAITTAMKLPSFSPSQGYSYSNESPAFSADGVPSSSLTKKTIPKSRISATAASALNSNVSTPVPSSSVGTPGGTLNASLTASLSASSSEARLSQIAMARALGYSLSSNTVYLDDAPTTGAGSSLAAFASHGSLNDLKPKVAATQAVPKRRRKSTK